MKSDDGLPAGATPEVVAYKLMQIILEIEGRPLGGENTSKLSRNVMLDVYADCIQAVRGSRPKRNLRAAT